MTDILRISFWGLNICFLLIAYLGILPFLGKEFIADLWAGILPVDLFLTFIGIVAIPTFCCISRASFFLGYSESDERTYDEEKGTIINIHDSNLTLGKLLFGIEAPLLILCIARLFWLRELTPASTLMILAVGVSVLSYGYELVRFNTFYSPILTGLQIIGHSLILLLGVYIGIVGLFYLIPALYVGAIASIWGIFFPPLFLFTITLIALMSLPYGMAITYTQAWVGFSHRFSKIYGRTKANLITSLAIATWILIIAIVQIQPQNQIFALLENPQTPKTALIQSANQIRFGLLNAYLARYRYPDYGSSNDIIRSFYGSSFLQSIHDFLISPFVYKGMPDDSLKAETLYAKFFDRPIMRGEQQAIANAVNATFIRSDAKAGLLSVNQRKVLLAKQELQIKPQGDWANVEIHEIYQNQTSDQQEIFYAFSLPESAVLTGVWLGDNDAKAKAFPFTVSPRGAAQAVYNAEVQRRVDPALLEQVGSRSYRLRVFPIPPNLSSRWSSSPANPESNSERTSQTNSRTEVQPIVIPSNSQNIQMNMWMSYKVMATKDGWALPQIAEKRNVFWAKDTKRIYNGKDTAINEDTWFPNFIAANQKPQIHQVDFPNGDRLTAKPIQEYKLPQAQKFAIVLDTSYSMNAHKQKLEETLKVLKNQDPSNSFDVYLTVSERGKPQKIKGINNFDLKDVTLYGLLRPQELLQQFTQLRSNQDSYDAILVISDEGNYELTDENAKVPVLASPLWMVHLGGLPASYDDGILDTIQSTGGGVGTDMEEVLKRIATKFNLSTQASSEINGKFINAIDGYAWYQAPKSTPNSEPTLKNDFLPVAARQLIQSYSRSLGCKVDVSQTAKLEQLDAVHNLAKRYSIVTPYSSMIVLVNDRQRELLKQAETQGDRFNRKVEDSQLPSPTSVVPSLSGVPEPSEWLLIGIVAFILGWIKYRQKLIIKIDS